MKPDRNQYRLDFEGTYQERFRLLASIPHERSGLTRTRWRNVRLLLEAIHSMPSGAQCWASVAWLAERAKLSRRTLDRARRDALELGVLEVHHRARRTGNGGRDTNLWEVVWPRVARLGVASPRPSGVAAPPREVECQDAQVECQDAQVECQLGTAIEESLELSLPRRDGSRATESFCWSDARLDQARAMGNKLIAAVGPFRDARDRPDAAKAVVLAMTRFGEHWLWDIAEGVKRRKTPAKNPWAYFRRCLRESLAELGHDFGVVMARCQPPEALLRTKSPLPLPLSARERGE